MPVLPRLQDASFISFDSKQPGVIEQQTNLPENEDSFANFLNQVSKIEEEEEQQFKQNQFDDRVNYQADIYVSYKDPDFCYHVFDKIGHSW